MRFYLIPGALLSGRCCDAFALPTCDGFGPTALLWLPAGVLSRQSQLNCAAECGQGQRAFYPPVQPLAHTLFFHTPLPIE
jgi:hypothetical protein